MNQTEIDKELLVGLSRSDKRAVEQIYRDHYTMIQSMILNNNGSPDDAADIFQEAMIVLFEKSSNGTFELNCQLKTYLYSVCRRLWLKKLQSQSRLETDSSINEQTIPVEEDLEFHEKHQLNFTIMENALAKLGEPCKSLLEAYYIQQKGMQLIATEFGYTNAENAKTQKYKCLVRLKKLFFTQYKYI